MADLFVPESDEAEANQFAFELLMPEDMVLLDVRERFSI